MVRVVTGDETGLAKVVRLEKKMIAPFGQQGKMFGVERMCFSGTTGDPNGVEGEIAVARRDNVVVGYDLQSGTQKWSVKDVSGCIKGMEVFNVDGERTLLTCSDTGAVEFKTLSAHQRVARTFQISKPVQTIRTLSHYNLLAAGGDNMDLELWDLTTQQQTFKARNVKNDFLDLRVPLSVVGIDSLENDPNKWIYASAHQELRIYDIRVQKRPVQIYKTGEVKITTFCLWRDPTTRLEYPIIGEAEGRIAKFEMRKGGLLAGVMKGSAGSIRGLVCHPTLPLVASVGLDRHLRIHHIKSRKTLFKVYLKQRLTSVLFNSDLEETMDDKKPKVAQDDDENESEGEMYPEVQSDPEDAENDEEDEESVNVEAQSEKGVASSSAEDDDEEEDSSEEESPKKPPAKRIISKPAAVRPALKKKQKTK